MMLQIFSASSNLFAQRHLVSSINFDRKIARCLADRQEVFCGDYYFALRNENAVDCPAVDDTGDAIAEVSPDNGVYNVSAQTGNVRQRWRLGVEQFHMNFPLPKKAREHSNTPATTCAVVFHIIRFRAAPCASAGQSISSQTHDSVHCRGSA